MALDEGVSLSNEENERNGGNDLGISCSLDMFRETEEVLNLIDNIPNTVKSELKAEKDFEDLKTLLDQYQVIILRLLFKLRYLIYI